jgi:hypothetical protein
MLLFSFIQEKKTYGNQEIPDFLKNMGRAGKTG